MLPYRDSKLTRTALIAFFLLALAYAYYEGRGLILGPSISIDGRAMEVSEQFITVEGVAERIKTLTMNGRDITVTEDGAFSERYVLTPGYNRITLTAIDRYGKSAERSIEIVYTPRTSAATSTPASSTTPVAP